MNENVKKRIYYAAKDNMPMAIFLIIQNLDEPTVETVFNEIVEDGQMRVNPLMIVAQTGNTKILRFLLSKYHLDLECEGALKIEGHFIKGATPLWIAACSGNLTAVKLLIRAGADVNHATSTISTPLRAACFDGRLDIMRYLVRHQANINQANQYNNTCLMLAAYKGYFDVVRYLLENGARTNERVLCGATALHFAAENGHLDIIRELIENYSVEVFVENGDGMTAIKIAAGRGHSTVVEYLLDHPEITKLEQIESLELLGASYFNSKEHSDPQIGYNYLYRSMCLRYSDADAPIRKVLKGPIAAYNHHNESQTVDDLETIRYDRHSLYMESLTIYERIMGITNPELPHAVTYRGAVYADEDRFERCIPLWLYALRLRQTNAISAQKDLLRFAEVFSQMLPLKTPLDSGQVIEVFAAAVTELEHNQKRLFSPDFRDEPETIVDELEMNLATTLYLITILTKLFEGFNEEEEFNVERLVFTLNKLQLKLRDGQTLLHLACNAETPVDDFYTNNVCIFPCAETARLLIKCGANVNAMDFQRNTPLHLIVNYHRPISDFCTLHSIITDLIEAGAHLDSVNQRGETPLEATATEIAEIILKTQSTLSLKCLAASAIKQHRIRYLGQVPKALEGFIDLHGL